MLDKKMLDNYSKDYAGLLINIKNTTSPNKHNELNKKMEFLKNKYDINKYDIAENIQFKSKNQKKYLDQNIQDVINNSKNNKESIIKNLEKYKLNTEISPKNYLVTSILIETLKLENDKDILYHSSRTANAKCEASTIGGLIGGAVAGCGAGAWGGPAGCVIGGTFGAIGGALAGWGNNPSC